MRCGISVLKSTVTSMLLATRMRLVPVQHMLSGLNILSGHDQRASEIILKTMPIYVPKDYAHLRLGDRVLVSWRKAVGGMLHTFDVNSCEIFTTSWFAGSMTHLVIDECSYKDRLRKERLSQAVLAAGIDASTWENVAQSAQSTRECIVDVNGHGMWSRADWDLIKVATKPSSSLAGSRRDEAGAGSVRPTQGATRWETGEL